MPPMLRRRRTPKPQTPAPRADGRLRRRARPEAPVPPRLLLAPQVEEEVKSARTRKPPAMPRHEPPAHKRERRAAQGVVLVTGFEPFAGETMNPSWTLCERLPRTIAGLRVEVQRIPCEFRRAIEVAAEAIDRLDPDLVIAVGQAGGRTHVGVERVAINVDDARIADNSRSQPVDEPIAANGPPAYFATVPVKAMVAAMRAAGVPAELSNSAGTYVCNHVMYGVLHYLAASGQHAPAGFIHVPFAEEQVLAKPGTASMAIATMARAVEAAIAAAVQHAHDIRQAEGALD